MGMLIKSERIKLRREALGYSQSALAKLVGVSQQMIGKLESGDGNNSAHIYKIARELETTVEFLTGETDNPDLGALPRPTKEQISDQIDAVSITELDLSLGMGGMAIFDGEIEQKQIVFSRAWIKNFTDSHPSKLFFVRGMGDSMNPTIQDNDICLVDTSQNSPVISDKIWAITHYGGGQIKRLRHYQTGFKIISDNPNVPDDVAMDGELHVIGRVIAIVRRV